MIDAPVWTAVHDANTSLKAIPVSIIGLESTMSL